MAEKIYTLKKAIQAMMGQAWSEDHVIAVKKAALEAEADMPTKRRRRLIDSLLPTGLQRREVDKKMDVEFKYIF